MNAASASPVAPHGLLSATPCGRFWRHHANLTPRPWTSLEATNYVVIGGYFLPLMTAYLNILSCYELRSFEGRGGVSLQEGH